MPSHYDLLANNLNPSALLRLQIALQQQAEAEAEQQRQQALKLQLENDPLERAKREAAAELFRNRRDVRPMSIAEESGFLGGGEPMGGGVEAMRPRAGVPLGPMVGPPAGQGGIERGITAPSFGQPQTISDVVPRVRGGRPRITEGAEAPRRTTAKLRGLGPGNEFQGGMVAADSPEPPRRIMSRAAFTDRDTPMTEMRMARERFDDPNKPKAMAQRRAEASLSPAVIPSENYAAADVAAAGIAAGAKPKSGLTEYQRFGATRALQGDFGRVAGPALDMARQVDLMQKGLERLKAGDTNAGGQAVLVTFQKILDPTSVVRESEYFRTTQGQSLIAQIEGLKERWSQGGTGVPVADMEQFVRLAKQAYQGMRDPVIAERDRMKGLAEAFELNPDLIFRTLPEFADDANEDDEVSIRIVR